MEHAKDFINAFKYLLWMVIPLAVCLLIVGWIGSRRDAAIEQAEELMRANEALAQQLLLTQTVAERCDRVVLTCLSWQAKVRMSLDAAAERCGGRL